MFMNSTRKATTGICMIVLLGTIPVAGQPTHELSPSDGNRGFDVVFDSNYPIYFPAGTVIQAGTGASGESIIGKGHVMGGNGGAGGDIILSAPRIVFGPDVKLIAGNGGPGGRATAFGAPDAFAEGGDGGPGGQVLIQGEVVGVPFIQHGRGGFGGNADATGASACAGEHGQDHTIERSPASIGEPGAEASANGTDGACGPPNGKGGHGGNATAIGGNGGLTPAGPGAAGGDATAHAGKGGDGIDLCTSDKETFNEWYESGYRAGDGGFGGSAIAHGGAGGDSLGGEGGPGGDALARSKAGKGGNGTTLTGGRFMLSTWDEKNVFPGDGEIALPGEVKGGRGGNGTSTGGPGGSANSTTISGAGGNACLIHQGPSSMERTAVGLGALGVGLILLGLTAWSSRHRRR